MNALLWPLMFLAHFSAYFLWRECMKLREEILLARADECRDARHCQDMRMAIHERIQALELLVLDGQTDDGAGDKT